MCPALAAHRSRVATTVQGTGRLRRADWPKRPVQPYWVGGVSCGSDAKGANVGVRGYREARPRSGSRGWCGSSRGSCDAAPLSVRWGTSPRLQILVSGIFSGDNIEILELRCHGSPVDVG
jgi:hypothetical protein